MTGPSPGAAPPRRVAIVPGPSQHARAERLAAAIPALVPCSEASVLPMDAAASGLAEATALVVLLAAREVPTGLSALLDAAEESRIAVLLLAEAPGAGPAVPGVAVEPLGSGDETVAAVLRGMLGRQPEVARLGRELAVATRFNGGLRGEVARMQEELQLAAQVQREFLPRPAQRLGSIRVEAFWRPASYVSGDVYEVTRLDERRIGVFIADAVGHGVPAALLTMVICRGLPSKDVGMGTYRIVPPGEALARINAVLVQHQDRVTRFATAAYCIIDTETGRATVAGAGHPPPVLLRADGSMELVEAGGGLLGVFEGEQYPETAIELRPGDRMLLHSDGFEQAFPGDPEGGRQARLPSKRYLDEFMAVRDAPDAASLVRQVERRIDMQFGSVRQADDITLVAVERMRQDPD